MYHHLLLQKSDSNWIWPSQPSNMDHLDNCINGCNFLISFEKSFSRLTARTSLIKVLHRELQALQTAWNSVKNKQNQSPGKIKHCDIVHKNLITKLSSVMIEKWTKRLFLTSKCPSLFSGILENTQITQNQYTWESYLPDYTIYNPSISSDSREKYHSWLSLMPRSSKLTLGIPTQSVSNALITSHRDSYFPKAVRAGQSQLCPTAQDKGWSPMLGEYTNICDWQNNCC